MDRAWGKSAPRLTEQALAAGLVLLYACPLAGGFLGEPTHQKNGIERRLDEQRSVVKERRGDTVERRNKE